MAFLTYQINNFGHFLRSLIKSKSTNALVMYAIKFSIEECQFYPFVN